MTPRVLSEDRPRAAKRHRCFLCGLMIEVGTVHRASNQLIDDRVETFRSHLPCEEIATAWGLYDPVADSGAVWEMISMEVDLEVPPPDDLSDEVLARWELIADDIRRRRPG